jgi:hypothetical protein
MTSVCHLLAEVPGLADAVDADIREAAIADC